MKLINNTKSKFITSKGDFLIGKIMDFDKEEAKTLLRYNGIESVESLERESEEVIAEEVSEKHKKSKK